MRTTFLEFVNNKNQINESSISIKKIDEYIEKVNELLNKHISNLVPLVGYVTTKSSKSEFTSKQYIVINKPDDIQLFQINWIKGSNSIEPYSIDFFKNMDLAFTGKSKSDLTIQILKDSSLIYFLPIIWTVVNTKDYNLSEREAIDLGRKVFKDSNNIKESLYYVGALRYHLFEGAIEVNNYRAGKYNELKKAEAERNKSKEHEKRYQQLEQEYDIIRKAILGGTTEVKDIELAISKNVQITSELSPSVQKIQKQIEEETEDPEQVFKKMEGYIKMVLKGLNPSLILCGAPGVGKTFRVKKQLKAAGYKDGDNLYIIKGKCSPRHLYLALYKFKDKGDIVLIDDADSLIGPKAPEDCINILKGALDSSSEPEGRLISYGIAGKITDDDGNELPKRFYYNGSVIIITNYNAGSLDTALRGRSYIQDIHFSVDQVLTIIERLLPELNQETISMTAKTKAFKYLKELAEQKSEMEISLRTFNICAMLFESMDDEELARAMIKEQMKLQADRLKNKY